MSPFLAPDVTSIAVSTSVQTYSERMNGSTTEGITVQSTMLNNTGTNETPQGSNPTTTLNKTGTKETPQGNKPTTTVISVETTEQQSTMLLITTASPVTTLQTTVLEPGGVSTSTREPATNPASSDAPRPTSEQTSSAIAKTSTQSSSEAMSFTAGHSTNSASGTINLNLNVFFVGFSKGQGKEFTYY